MLENTENRPKSTSVLHGPGSLLCPGPPSVDPHAREGRQRAWCNVNVFQSLGFSVESEQATSLFESTLFGELTEVFMKKHLQSKSRGTAT